MGLFCVPMCFVSVVTLWLPKRTLWDLDVGVKKPFFNPLEKKEENFSKTKRFYVSYLFWGVLYYFDQL